MWDVFSYEKDMTSLTPGWELGHGFLVSVAWLLDLRGYSRWWPEGSLGDDLQLCPPAADSVYPYTHGNTMQTSQGDPQGSSMHLHLYFVIKLLGPCPWPINIQFWEAALKPLSGGGVGIGMVGEEAEWLAEADQTYSSGFYHLMKLLRLRWPHLQSEAANACPWVVVELKDMLYKALSKEALQVVMIGYRKLRSLITSACLEIEKNRSLWDKMGRNRVVRNRSIFYLFNKYSINTYWAPTLWQDYTMPGTI